MVILEMPNVERVTVTLPESLVRDIDRREENRSKFVAEAVRRELDRRRRCDLRRSLASDSLGARRGVGGRREVRLARGLVVVDLDPSLGHEQRECERALS